MTFPWNADKWAGGITGIAEGLASIAVAIEKSGQARTPIVIMVPQNVSGEQLQEFARVLKDALNGG